MGPDAGARIAGVPVDRVIEARIEQLKPFVQAMPLTPPGPGP